MVQKTECLDIQLGIRLTSLHRAVGFCITTHCDVITRDGTLTKVLKYMGRAMIVACFSHRKINECSVNPGHSAYCTIGCRIFPCKVELCDFKICAGKRTGKGQSSPRHLLVPDVESSFLRFTVVELTNNNPKRSRIAGPMRSDKA